MTIIAFMVGVYLFINFFMRPIFMDFLAELTAGFSGILVGFGLNRQIELGKKTRTTKQIVSNLLVELRSNLDLIKEVTPEIERKHERGTIFYFALFQTNTRDMFSSRLELDDMEILFDLGSVYYRFQLFNEGMKLEGTTVALSFLLGKSPAFFRRLEKDLEDIIGRLGSVKNPNARAKK